MLPLLLGHVASYLLDFQLYGTLFTVTQLSLKEEPMSYLLSNRPRLMLAIGATAAILAVAACSHKEHVDLVNGITPVSTGLLASTAPVIADLANVPASQREAYIERNWPHLRESLVHYMRIGGKVPQNAVVQNVEFFYGSLPRAKAEDAGGHYHDGFFNNQLVAMVYLVGNPKPVTVLVGCTNGMLFTDVNDQNHLADVGGAAPVEQFTIGPRQGLTSYVSEALSIDLAEQHGLPVYRTKYQVRSDRITYATARHVDTNQLQVTVHVCTGDYFDLAAGTYTPARGCHHR